MATKRKTRRRPATVKIPSWKTNEKRKDTIAKNQASIKEKIQLAMSKNKVEPITEEYKSVLEMGSVYEEFVSTYRGEEIVVFGKIISKGSRSYGMLLRAVNVAKELSVPPKKYMEALFSVADDWGNRPPHLWELGSTKGEFCARERAKAFLLINNTTEIKKVVGPTSPAPEMSRAARFKYAENSMNDFMDNYEMTEREILKNFASGPNTFMFFDQEWLNNNKLYQKMKEDGDIQ